MVQRQLRVLVPSLVYNGFPSTSPALHVGPGWGGVVEGINGFFNLQVFKERSADSGNHSQGASSVPGPE